MLHSNRFITIAKFSEWRSAAVHRVSAARLDKYTRLQILFSKEALSGSYPVPHMAPPTPSADISVSVCGRSRQCFRSYPRNYTSVWLSAPTPGPQDVGTRYQTLIACRAHPSSISTPTSSCLARFTSSLSFRLLSRRITNNDVHFLNEKKIKRPKIYIFTFEKSQLK